ncbi:MAG TPA: DUF2249 domain-containing protein [Abditibacteriaceae bacterium]|jgi:uncharacterized protein (DUF2249 family)/quercetin dioxygenase-like cupin family protein
MSQVSKSPAVIDVRPIAKQQRHPMIFDALELLAIGESIVIKNDHNPLPLRGQVETIYGEQFSWAHLEEGPEVFQLQFTRRAPAPDGWHRPMLEESNLPLMQPATTPSPVAVDLLDIAHAATRSGPQWAHESEDLDITLLSWQDGRSIEAHVNSEVDVVWIGIGGEGIAIINGEEYQLRPGVALLIPKGSERAVKSTSRLSYLSVHRRRRGLMPTLGGKPLL